MTINRQAAIRFAVTGTALAGFFIFAGPLGFSTPLPVVVLGIIIGATYGLLAVGLILIYRANRVINFAQGEIGVFAAAVFGLAYNKSGLNYYLVLPVGLAVGAATGMVAETAVIRRLRNAPRIMSVVATLGIGQFLVLFGSALNSKAGAGASFPSPPGLGQFSLGALVITPAYLAMLIVAPVAVLAIAVFLRRSRFGLGIRGSADNPDAARMGGIPAARMSTLAWALSGLLSAVVAILTQPTVGYVAAGTFGPSLLLRALTGAVLARMNSLPGAMIAGMLTGVGEQLLVWNYPQSGFVDVVLLIAIVIALLLQRQQGGRAAERGSWATVETLRPLPEILLRSRAVRRLPMTTAGGVVAAALLLTLGINDSTAVTLVTILGFSIVGFSSGIVTGLAGQLSLGQFAVAAVGAWAYYGVSHPTGNAAIGFLYAGGAGGLASVILGIPALRIKGLFYTVTTLAFSLAMSSWLLQQDFFLGPGVVPHPPSIDHHAISLGRPYYVFAVLVTALAALVAHNIRRSGFGRKLRAIRDNEDAARAFSIRAWFVNVQGFMLAGIFAGIGGALLAGGQTFLASSSFPASSSIDIVTMTVVGGISLLVGPIIGAFVIIGVPAFLPLDSAGLAATKLGALLIVLYLPNGLGGVIGPIRDRVVRVLARREGIDAESAFAEVASAAGSSGGRAVLTLPDIPPPKVRTHGSPLLRASGLARSFGGVQAVRGVDLTVDHLETVALIGPNGAGKTTTFELLSGFTTPDRGSIDFNGRQITDLGPEARAGQGLIRSFQDAGLFATLSVEDTVKLAFERTRHSSAVAAFFGAGSTERETRVRAREMLDFMGLDGYRRSAIRELSTGTRRITEIACLLALQPTLLLLDEPSSGVAQRESEALGRLLRRIRDELGVTLLIIEHDIPLVMSLADRIIVMAEGEVIANGPPAAIKSDERVIAAYLGGSREALERSGPLVTTGAPV